MMVLLCRFTAATSRSTTLHSVFSATYLREGDGL